MPKTTSLKWTDLRVGVVVIAGIAVLIMLILAVSGDLSIFSKRAIIYTDLPGAEGLKNGDEVRIAGVKAGTVKKVTFSTDGAAGAGGVAGFGGAAGAVGVAGFGGCAAGGATGGATGFGATAPSQFSAAVAGVQFVSRQHSSLVPFFQTVAPSVARQLSIDLAWAKTAIGAASAADAKSTATLFSFFMILLSRKAAVGCVTSKSEVGKASKHAYWRRFATDESLCHRVFGRLRFRPSDAACRRSCCKAATATPGHRIADRRRLPCLWAAFPGPAFGLLAPRLTPSLA